MNSKIVDRIFTRGLSGPLAAVVDAPFARWERDMGLGDDARRVYYGAGEPPYSSLLLSYSDSLLKKAGDEKCNGEIFPADDLNTENRFSADLLKKMISGRNRANAADDVTRFINDVKDNAPIVLEGDTLTPHERVRRHIHFENADRVAVAPLPGFNIGFTGGLTVREYMTDGRKAAAACRRFHDVHGGFDMLPLNFPAGYLFPFFPDTHTRFWSNWVMPEENELPKLDEVPVLSGYDEILESGIIHAARTEAGKLFPELLKIIPEVLAFSAGTAWNFPNMKHYYPYASSIINHPADLLSMWIGFENFMMDCIRDPLKIKEACEMLGPGLVEAGEFVARLTGSNQVLYGVSRISGSWISRKMFDDLFAETFLGQCRRLHDDGFCITYHLDNDYTPMLDFFRELPRHSGIMHLDQTDMAKAKEELHGHLCLMGNLHPGVTAAGTPQEVEAECERLIKEVGADGGFILAGSCELPVNAPVENIKALKKAVDKHGWYH